MKLIFKKTILALVFLIAFNVMFFLFGGTENVTSVWVSYGFIHFAYLAILILPLVKTNGDDAYYLQSSMYYESIGYFIMELIVGLVFIYYKMDDYMWSVIIQGTLAALFMIRILTLSIVNDCIADAQQAKQQTMNTSNSIKANFMSAMDVVKDNGARVRLMNLSDKFAYSGNRHIPQTMAVEEQIVNSLETIKTLVVMKNDTPEAMEREMNNIERLIVERASILKFNR